MGREFSPQGGEDECAQGMLRKPEGKRRVGRPGHMREEYKNV
jgi:hypothetical protein